MPKLTNVRERVHQPFRDSLIRSAGWSTGAVNDVTQLFTVAGKPQGETNLTNGSTLPSDQSMVVLALRAFTWFRNSLQRGTTSFILPDGTSILTANGDYHLPTAAANSAAFAALLNGNAVGGINDVYRLHWQAEEQLLWSFGAGDKFSITSMPTAYFPYGGGLHGDFGSTTDLIHWNNGMPSHDGILRLARAILIPPRQNIKCEANIARLDTGPAGQIVQSTQGNRDMYSLRDNLNAPDGVQKVVTYTFDGLFSRDVQ